VNSKDKSKKIYTETYYNQTAENQRQKENLKNQEKQLITYKRSSMVLTTDFSKETIQAKRQWKDTFKLLKEKKFPNKNSVSNKLSFKSKGDK